MRLRSTTSGLELIAFSLSFFVSGISGLALSPRTCGWHGGEGTYRGPQSRGLAGGGGQGFYWIIDRIGCGWRPKLDLVVPIEAWSFITFPFLC